MEKVIAEIGSKPCLEKVRTFRQIPVPGPSLSTDSLEASPWKRVENSFDRYDNEEVALRSSIQGSQSRREVALAMLNQLFPFLTGGEPSSLLSSRLSMPQEENCPLWRGIGLYPDNRLKKKAMCALPFLESLYFIDMSDTILEYTIQLLSGLALPAALQILANWRVARLRNLTIYNYTEKVDESVANTIKEQLSERVITPLFTNNNVVLPPEKNAYDIIDALVPGDLGPLFIVLALTGLELGKIGEVVSYHYPNACAIRPRDMIVYLSLKRIPLDEASNQERCLYEDSARDLFPKVH
ncbi:hypothetical protein Tco_1359528 [Tanacetum coccineum]